MTKTKPEQDRLDQAGVEIASNALETAISKSAIPSYWSHCNNENREELIRKLDSEIGLLERFQKLSGRSKYYVLNAYQESAEVLSLFVDLIYESGIRHVDIVNVFILGRLQAFQTNAKKYIPEEKLEEFDEDLCRLVRNSSLKTLDLTRTPGPNTMYYYTDFWAEMAVLLCFRYGVNNVKEVMNQAIKTPMKIEKVVETLKAL